MTCGSETSRALKITCCAPASESSPNRSTTCAGVSPAPVVGLELHGLERRALDLGGIAADRRAVLARIAYLRGSASGAPKTLHASAYWATRRSVFRSPPPPIMIGGRGRVIACGRVEQAARVDVAALERRLRPVARPSHIAWAIAQRLLEHLEALAERREREPEAERLLLVPGGADPEPCPAARQDVERRRRLDPQAGLAVVDAADHQAEPGPRGVAPP